MNFRIPVSAGTISFTLALIIYFVVHVLEKGQVKNLPNRLYFNLKNMMISKLYFGIINSGINEFVIPAKAGIYWLPLSQEVQP